jgi:hypothetical protein
VPQQTDLTPRRAILWKYVCLEKLALPAFATSSRNSSGLTYTVQTWDPVRGSLQQGKEKHGTRQALAAWLHGHFFSWGVSCPKNETTARKMEKEKRKELQCM